MTDIKVGHILNLGVAKFVVIRIELGGIFIGIFPDGFTTRGRTEGIREHNIVSSYPTWQEAVNSKEFKDEK